MSSRDLDREVAEKVMGWGDLVKAFLAFVALMSFLAFFGSLIGQSGHGPWHWWGCEENCN